MQCSSCATSCRFHLFASPNIPGVAELAAELQEHAKVHGGGGALAVTSDHKEMGACMHYLLDLSKRTHDATLPHVGALYDEVTPLRSKPTPLPTQALDPCHFFHSW